MIVQTRFKLKQVVQHMLDGSTYLVVGICLYPGRTYTYLCSDSSSGTKWFKEFELTGERLGEKMGYKIKG